MGPGRVPGVVHGIAPPGYPSPPPPRVHPSPTTAADVIHAPTAGSAARVNSAVGLKSVDQLSLGPHFSDIKGMTEVYNLV